MKAPLFLDYITFPGTLPISKDIKQDLKDIYKGSHCRYTSDYSSDKGKFHHDMEISSSDERTSVATLDEKEKLVACGERVPLLKKEAVAKILKI